MKKLLSIILVVVLVLGMSAVTALAEGTPTISGEVSGIITNDTATHFSGYVTGAYNLTISGEFTGSYLDSHHAYFNGTVSGDFSGTITNGIYNNNGLDTMYAVITGTGATDTVRIQGVFLKSGITGDFAGEIVVGTAPAAVTSLSITCPSNTMKAGTSMQMTAVTDPVGPYDVAWSVWLGATDDPVPYEYAWIDQSGVLHAYQPCTITVVANTLDPLLASTTKSITIVDPSTEVLAAVDPTYTIIIPASVDFGTLVKDGSTVTQDFDVTAQGIVIEDGSSIDVSVAGPFVMMDQDGAGSVPLAYTLSNGDGAITPPDTFATFTGNGTEDGEVSVNTAAITAAGSYQGTMVFTITYND